MSKRVALFATTALFSVSLLAAQAQAKTAAEFVDKAMIGGQFEVQSSQTALQKSSNAAVKQFAQHMVDDHTKGANELKTVISDNHINIQAPTQDLDKKHQSMLDHLNKASPADFDKIYVKDQVSAHKEAVSLYKDYAKSGDEANLKAFAKQTLPMLKEHRREVNKLSDSM